MYRHDDEPYKHYTHMGMSETLSRMMITLFCISLSLSVSGCGEGDDNRQAMIWKTDKSQTEKKIKTVKVTTGTFTDSVIFEGHPYYTKTFSESIKEDDAYIDKLYVSEGDHIRKGQRIARYHIDISKTTLKKKRLELDKQITDYNVKKNKAKRAVLSQKKKLSQTVGKDNRHMEKLELNRLKEEYKAVVREGAYIRRGEKAYKKLVQSTKGTILKARHTGTVYEKVDMAEQKDSLITGIPVIRLRDENDFLIKTENEEEGQSVYTEGALDRNLRYMMSVKIGLGSNRDKCKYNIKGKVISVQSLGSYDDDTTSRYIRISKKDRKNKGFKDKNIFVKAVLMEVKNALLIDADAVYEEQAGITDESMKKYVMLYEGGKMHKRYIVSSYRTSEKVLVLQGVKEGQECCILSDKS